jgi:hypothetical protein
MLRSNQLSYVAELARIILGSGAAVNPLFGFFALLSIG